MTSLGGSSVPKALGSCPQGTLEAQWGTCNSASQRQTRRGPWIDLVTKSKTIFLLLGPCLHFSPILQPFCSFLSFGFPGHFSSQRLSGPPYCPQATIPNLDLVIQGPKIWPHDNQLGIRRLCGLRPSSGLGPCWGFSDRNFTCLASVYSPTKEETQLFPSQGVVGSQERRLWHFTNPGPPEASLLPSHLLAAGLLSGPRQSAPCHFGVTLVAGATQPFLESSSHTLWSAGSGFKVPSVLPPRISSHLSACPQAFFLSPILNVGSRREGAWVYGIPHHMVNFATLLLFQLDFSVLSSFLSVILWGNLQENQKMSTLGETSENSGFCLLIDSRRNGGTEPLSGSARPGLLISSLPGWNLSLARIFHCFCSASTLLCWSLPEKHSVFTRPLDFRPQDVVKGNFQAKKLRLYSQTFLFL